MPNRRPLPLLVAGLLALALSASPAAAASSASGVELTDGSGRVGVALRGAVLGTIERGRVTVRQVGSATRWKVEGYDWVQRGPKGQLTYGGQGIRFRFLRGSFRVRLQGSGIDVSAAGKGTLTLRGAGEYLLPGEDARAWPSAGLTIRLTGLAGRPELLR